MNAASRRAAMRAAEALAGGEVSPDAASFDIADALPETPSETIARLAKLDGAAYEAARRAEAKRLGWRTSALDAAVAAARGAESPPAAGRTVALADVAPWPHPVTTADLLDGLAAAIRRHVVLTGAAADATALWIAHTWIYERFDYTPRLAITSPTHRCGKSTLLELLRLTCRRTLKADSVSAAGLFRVVEAWRPLTLLADETDSYLPEAEELRGILNSGYEATGQAIRVVEQSGVHQPVAFLTFCAVALAGIGDLPPTLADRAVPVRLERKAASETVTRLRHPGARAALADLARKAARWAADAGPALPADPAIPDRLGDRQGDISVPLLSIANLAGAAWAARARRALVTLFAGQAAAEAGAETAALLLADIKTIFLGMSALRMESADLCSRLAGDDSRPWAEWRHGKPITPPQLARALRPFGIRPTKLGAKNWMYIGHPDAGWRSAVIYSITGSCALLKINPVDYLTWVLPRLVAATSGQVDGLLPHDYAATLAAA
ncbi:MAG: DUF3631 domain-containing protein [Acetobacteraceae bacterium]